MLRRIGRYIDHDIFALGLILLFAYLSLGFLLRYDLFIYGDHPGQFFRLWYPLEVSWPTSHRLVDWNPYWYAGYPELQFYPPGFVILGWVVRLLSAGWLSTVQVYQFLAFLAYLLPALTSYLLLSRVFSGHLRHTSTPRLMGLAGALLTLIFPEIWGGVGSVFIGLLGARLAFGLFPLALYFGIWGLEKERPLAGGVLTGSVLGAIILMHPFHAVAPALAILLYLLFRGRQRVQALSSLALALFIALGIAAFWLLPLFARSQYTTPILRATLDQTRRWLVEGRVPIFVLLALPAVAKIFMAKEGQIRAFLATLTLLPILLATFIILDHLILIQRLRFYLLDPVRFIAEVYLSLVLLAGVGIVEAISIPLRLKIRSAGIRYLASGLLAVILIYIIYKPFLGWVEYYKPRPDGEPRFLSQADNDYQLEDVWEVLRNGQGRILFTSAYLHLHAKGEEPFPTSLKSMIPYFINRQIIGGTFSHWSPVARYLWLGQSDVPVLRGRVETEDDKSLFGTPWPDMTDERLFELCRRLNVTTIVATIDDFNARTFLDQAPHFTSYYNNGLLFLYRVEGYASAWVEAEGALAQVVSYEPRQIVVRIEEASDEAMLRVKVSYYPLWHAYVDELSQSLPLQSSGRLCDSSSVEGRRIEVGQDDLGLMRLRLPKGEDYIVTLRYEEENIERVGRWITMATIVFSVGFLAFKMLANKA